MPSIDYALKLEAASIVVNGNFNPSIFQPAWFSRNNLIRPDESDGAEVGIIARDIAQFKTKWLAIQVTQDKFHASTDNPEMYPVLKDVVVGAFKILEHCPVTTFGFNREHHYQMLDANEWHKLGHKLVPKHPWESFLRKVGTRTVVVEGERPTESKSKYVQSRLSPSTRFDNSVFIHFNQHYSCESLQPEEAIPFLLSELNDSWHDFLQYALASTLTLTNILRGPQ